MNAEKTRRYIDDSADAIAPTFAVLVRQRDRWLDEVLLERRTLSRKVLRIGRVIGGYWA